MSKVFKTTQESDELAALEIIELSIDDIDSLTRAFDMITNVCAELSNRPEKIEEPKLILH